MKKIIKSIAIVVAVGAVAGMATYSFFSDTETSTGNTFTAGKIDLKVDSVAHYNGMVCEDGHWSCEPWADSIDSFDQGKRKDGSNVLAERSITAKALGQAQNNDTLNFLSLGFGGEVVIDFTNKIVNGGGADIKIYETSYGNPSFENYPEKAEVYASQDGTSWTDIGEAKLDTELDLGSLTWAKYLKIVDTSDKTSSKFPNDADGYDIDGIKALHCETDPDLGNNDCDGTWGLTDLGAQKFFNFLDVKPGDFGEDTVSLHVYDNEAWGRMVVNVVDDSDNTCVDSEEEAEGNECTDDEGELRENLDFRVWLDEGITPGFQGKENDIGEGDNIKQDGEILLISPGPVDAPSETWLVKDAIQASYAAHGASSGITQDGHMVASNTYYFGIGWELPADVGNEVQTDKFTADVTFEVEQYRNNPSPF